MSEIIDDKGNWNLAALNTSLPTVVIEKILKIQINTGSQSDKVVWKGNKSGVLLVKTFFNFITKSTHE